MQIVHHVPGRIRIRILSIKGSPEGAARVATSIKALRGVIEVAANAVTGSVVVNYDARVARLEAIMSVLQAALPPNPVAAPLTALNPMARKLGQRLAKSLVEALLERSAMALIAAAL